MQDNVQSAFAALSCVSLSSVFFPFLPFCLFGSMLGLSDPVSIPSLFGRSPGCSPDSAPSPGRAHAGAVVDLDPPRSFPTRHVSVRHILVFVHFLHNVIILRSVSLSLRPRALLAPLSLLLARAPPARPPSSLAFLALSAHFFPLHALL